MPSLNKLSIDKIDSRTKIYVMYPFSAFIVLLLFHIIYSFFDSPQVELLPVYRFGNIITQAIIDFCDFFPAIFLSALVLPFGHFNRKDYKASSFSANFLTNMRSSILAGIISSLIYGILFLVVRPISADYQVHIKTQTILFNTAKEKTIEFSEKEAWDEAAHFLALCERIWRKNPALVPIRETVNTGIEKQMYGRARAFNNENDKSFPVIPGQKKPINAAEALSFADAAFKAERYYDAHWLSVMALRMAREGSVESRAAALSASKAWNVIAALETSAGERNIYSTYEKKRKGYEAMNSEDWITAYYIFLDLIQQTPNDPDVVKFLDMSEQGLRTVSFFLDEIESHTGAETASPIFSIPLWETSGRLVMRLSSLRSTADYSYGRGLEIVAFNDAHKPLFSLTAPYIKAVPMEISGDLRTLIYLEALDRTDSSSRWGPVWKGDISSIVGGKQILLDINYDQFLLASVAGVSLEGFFLRDLWDAADILDDYGFVPEVFQAKVISFIMQPFFYLPMTVFALILGWRFRTKRQAKRSYIIMFFVLPVVFNIFIRIVCGIINNLGVFAVLNIGFYNAVLLSCGIAFGLFLIGLFCLAVQRA